jgi:hypothetical protein
MLANMSDEAFPLMLTPTERLALEAIRDKGSAGPGGDAWAVSKSFFDRRKGGLTDAGREASTMMLPHGLRLEARRGRGGDDERQAWLLSSTSTSPQGL